MTTTERELRAIIAELWQATSGFIKSATPGGVSELPGLYDALCKACTIAREEGKDGSLPVAGPLEVLPNG